MDYLINKIPNVTYDINCASGFVRFKLHDLFKNDYNLEINHVIFTVTNDVIVNISKDHQMEEPEYRNEYYTKYSGNYNEYINDIPADMQQEELKTYIKKYIESPEYIFNFENQQSRFSFFYLSIVNFMSPTSQLFKNKNINKKEILSEINIKNDIASSAHSNLVIYDKLYNIMYRFDPQYYVRDSIDEYLQLFCVKQKIKFIVLNNHAGGYGPQTLQINESLNHFEGTCYWWTSLLINLIIINYKNGFLNDRTIVYLMHLFYDKIKRDYTFSDYINNYITKILNN